MQQNFSNLLVYIKTGLGQPINQLELSDDDIYKYIKEHVIPEFCSSFPEIIWTQILSGDILLADHYGKTYNQNTYEIYNPDNRKIVRVMNAYYNKEGILDTGAHGLTNTTDASFQNVISTMQESIDSSQAFLFIEPNIISFSKPLEGNSAVIEVGVEYEHDFVRMPNYLYTKCFRKLAFAAIIRYVIALRNKYQNLSTPFGQLNLNVPELQIQADKLEQDAKDVIDRHTPEILLAWL